MKIDGYEIVSESINVYEGAGKTALSVAALSTPVLPFWVIYRSLRSAFDEKTRRCGIYGINTSNRQLCMMKVEMEKLQRIMDIAKKSKAGDIAKQKYAVLSKKYDSLKEKMALKGRVEHKPSAVGTKKYTGFDRGGVAVRSIPGGEHD